MADRRVPPTAHTYARPVLTNRVQPTGTVLAAARRLEENAYVLPRPRAMAGSAPDCAQPESTTVPGPPATGAFRHSLDRPASARSR
jgi:hypothetical protein